jgi:HPt (histidine-containing phosphotransfer) domain-containing protein
MPFISLAALPYLKDYMMKEKLKEAKSVLLPELKKQILSLEESLDREVEKYVTAQCKAIDSNAKSAYVELIKDIEKDIQEKLSENQKKGSDISIVSSDISKFKSLLNTAIESE